MIGRRILPWSVALCLVFTGCSTSIPGPSGTPPASAVTTPGPSNTPSPSTAGTAEGRLAVIDLEGRLVTVAPDGSARRVLTPAGPRFAFPSWAPEGDQLAALAINGAVGEVYVLRDVEDARADAGAPLPRPLFSDAQRAPIYLDWSPDASQIAFLTPEPPDLGLHLVSAAGGAPSRVVAQGQPLYWDWLRDSERLLIHGGSGPDATLGTIDRVGEPIGPPLGSAGRFQSPAVSADGRSIAYAQVDGSGPGRLVIEGVDGADRREIGHDGSVAFAWSPEGQRLAYISPDEPREGPFGPLRLIEDREADPRLLTGETVLAFFWSPNGRSIAYLAPGSPSDPGQVALAGARAPVRPAAEHDATLDLVILDVAAAEERTRSTFQPSPLFLEQFLPFFDQYAHSHTIWSPASDAVVVPFLPADSTRPTIQVVPADGSGPHTVGEGVIAFWSND